MCLNEAKRKSLEDKDFHKLFREKKQNEKWQHLVSNARAFAKLNITQGKEPRLDDISGVLYSIIKADQDFRNHQDTHSAREDQWVEWFADYVVDQIMNAGKGHT
jgi:hypothetical protein